MLELRYDWAVSILWCYRKLVYTLFHFNYLIIDVLGHKFTFGSPGKFEFNFSGIRPRSPTKLPKSPGGVGSDTAADNDETDSEPEEDEGEHICFQVYYSLSSLNPSEFSSLLEIKRVHISSMSACARTVTWFESVSLSILYL